jgi:uncharacterized protein (TIGR00730 family)
VVVHQGRSKSAAKENLVTVCVYCSSSDSIAPPFGEEAAAIASNLAQAGWDLVYGGAKVGLMGLVAGVFLKHNRRVTGVIPRFMHQRGISQEGLSETVSTEDLRDRKAQMERRADAFLVLPGGAGTCEEFLETVTLKQLGRMNKPIVLVNTQGYYTDLLQFLQGMVHRRFAGRGLLSLFSVAAHPNQVLSLLGAGPCSPVPDKWDDASSH